MADGGKGGRPAHLKRTRQRTAVPLPRADQGRGSRARRHSSTHARTHARPSGEAGSARHRRLAGALHVRERSACACLRGPGPEGWRARGPGVAQGSEGCGSRREAALARVMSALCGLRADGVRARGSNSDAGLEDGLPQRAMRTVGAFARYRWIRAEREHDCLL